jgi:hypothetical protein
MVSPFSWQLEKSGQNQKLRNVFSAKSAFLLRLLKSMTVGVPQKLL